MTTAEEIEMAIENCKDMILTCEEKSEKRKSLVKKLIQLRMKLQEIKVSKIFYVALILVFNFFLRCPTSKCRCFGIVYLYMDMLMSSYLYRSNYN